MEKGTTTYMSRHSPQRNVVPPHALRAINDTNIFSSFFQARALLYMLSHVSKQRESKRVTYNFEMSTERIGLVRRLCGSHVSNPLQLVPNGRGSVSRISAPVGIVNVQFVCPDG